ncbi:hypothetical protein L3Y34_005400 [Caenorhabditis briggsae]|uniref:Hcy-binding domain-containing protein n=2 Tax=Caenorhabditis briggsae TaxID=6238 RepID=A0AAE9D627_CAEBR|nr:hypothetical protein L3Y34_005400 [Caenorhabditis briggsae]
MVRLMDGSMSVQLKQFGYDCNALENKPHWSFPANSDMHLMEQVYRSFLDLGSKIITTNTYHFGSTLDRKLDKNEENFEKTCNLLVNLAKEYEGIRIFGSVGTLATFYHDLSEYSGKYMDLPDAETTAFNYFHKILTIFQGKTKIRNLIFETIPSALEATVALDVLEQFPEMKAIFSFTFKENAHLRHGEHIETILVKLKKSKQIFGIGINCTDPENVLSVLKSVKNLGFPEIFVYPNMGDSRFLSGKTENFDLFDKELVENWVKNGTTAIGGCCGVTENQMRILKKLQNTGRGAVQGAVDGALPAVGGAVQSVGGVVQGVAGMVPELPIGGAPQPS